MGDLFDAARHTGPMSASTAALTALLGPAPSSCRIVAEAMSLRRGERLVLADLSFRVDPGTALAVRGANGSGKTTLLRALAGFIAPVAGYLTIASDKDPVEPACAWLGTISGLKPIETPRHHAAAWSGLKSGDARVSETLRLFGLAELAERPARMLSSGQKQRAALARLALSAAPIWLLDEPGSFLDDQGGALLAELVDAHCARGGLAVMATHSAMALTAPVTVLRLGS